MPSCSLFLVNYQLHHSPYYYCSKLVAPCSITIIEDPTWNPTDLLTFIPHIRLEQAHCCCCWFNDSKVTFLSSRSWSSIRLDHDEDGDDDDEMLLHYCSTLSSSTSLPLFLEVKVKQSVIILEDTTTNSLCSSDIVINTHKHAALTIFCTIIYLLLKYECFVYIAIPISASTELKLFFPLFHRLNQQCFVNNSSQQSQQKSTCG